MIAAPETLDPPRNALDDPAYERLDFDLPEFTRLTWVSDRARDLWEPRIARINDAMIEIEWRSVLAGVRDCCITMVSPDDFLVRGKVWARHGLNVLPIDMHGVPNSGYASASLAHEAGRPYLFRIVLGRAEDTAEFAEAWDASDQHAIGKFLGYPDCCREFFRDVWVERRMTDTSWAMGVATSPPRPGSGVVEASGPPQANILWRWMGVRLASHLPCRLDCPATIDLADRFVAVGRDAGFEIEMDWALEILSWSVEWSALHGIAEIKTPILKVSTKTDATARKLIIRYQGGRTSPEQAARGLGFPYRLPRLPILTESASFRRGLDNPIPDGHEGSDRHDGTRCDH